MFCHNCGNQITEASKFCDKCGTKLENIAPAKPIIKQDPFAEPGSIPSPSIPGFEVERKSTAKWIIIGILAIIVLGFIFDMVVLNKAESDYRYAVKETNRQFNRAMNDYNRHMNSIRW